MTTWDGFDRLIFLEIEEAEGGFISTDFFYIETVDDFLWIETAEFIFGVYAAWVFDFASLIGFKGS